MRTGWPETAADRREKAGQQSVRNATEGVVAVRIPDVEEITSAGREHAMHLAIRLVLVGIEHHAELADHDVEALVRERQRGRVGRLEGNLLRWLELCPGDLDHSGTEIGRCELRARGQMITQTPADDTGPGCGLEYAPWIQGDGAPRDILCTIDEDHRPEPGIVVIGDTAAGEAGGVLRHRRLTTANCRASSPASRHACPSTWPAPAQSAAASSAA